jgi:hypothetical protein
MSAIGMAGVINRLACNAPCGFGRKTLRVDLVASLTLPIGVTQAPLRQPKLGADHPDNRGRASSLPLAQSHKHTLVPPVAKVLPSGEKIMLAM